MDLYWISVNDSLPEADKKVVVARWDSVAQKYVRDIDRYIVDSETGLGRWTGDNRFVDAAVKFWLPLPDLPR